VLPWRSILLVLLLLWPLQPLCRLLPWLLSLWMLL
jgi:hypothetical protein